MFALKSNPAWWGGPLWGILSNHSHEVGQLWAWSIGSARRTAAGHHHHCHHCRMTAAVTEGATLSCLGCQQPRHGCEAFHAHGGKQLIVNRPIMRERDEFMSVNQLEHMATRIRGEVGANGGGVVDIEIVLGVGHFELERYGYIELVARTVLDWLDKIPA